MQSAIPRIYLAVQSALIVAWWTLLAITPTLRPYFAPDSIGGIRWLLWFLPADCLTVVGGLLAAWKWSFYLGRLGMVLCLIGISTQTLACLTVPFRTAGEGWLGVAAMIAASIATLACAGTLLAESSAAAAIFRPAPTVWTQRMITRRTLLQSAVLWPLFLVILPWTLSRLERAAGWTPPDDLLAMCLRWLVGGVLFAICGIINIATARAMIRHGKGTPLPICMANHLVTTGPYAYIRNPMAMSALGQGMSIAILLASPLTATYVLLGGIVWQLFIRPSEERDLSERFGEAYATYQQRVNCWLPRRTATKDTSNTGQ